MRIMSILKMKTKISITSKLSKLKTQKKKLFSLGNLGKKNNC